MTEGNRVMIWPRDELERVGDAEELQLASRRDDGSLRPYVTMWMVRAGRRDGYQRNRRRTTMSCFPAMSQP
jgi:hypothetical protein